MNDDTLDVESDATVESADHQNRWRSCTIIGPANAGKTTLLLAMQQASLNNAADEYALDFVPESEETVELLRLSAEFLFRGHPVPSSRAVVHYPFRIFVERKHHAEPEYFSSMNVTDGPGEHLFPAARSGYPGVTPDRSAMLASAQSAQTLVFCVDASEPSLETLYSGLPRLIVELKGESRKLPYRRVLLLLTKLDRIIDGFASSVDALESLDAIAGRLGPISAFGSRGSIGRRKEDVAALVSPLEQARWHVQTSWRCCTAPPTRPPHSPWDCAAPMVSRSGPPSAPRHVAMESSIRS